MPRPVRGVRAPAATGWSRAPPGYGPGMESTLQVVLVVVAGIAAAAWAVSVAVTAVMLDVARARRDAARVVDTAAGVERHVGRAALASAIVLAIAGSWYLWDRGLWSADAWWVGTAIGAWLVAFFGATLLRVPQLRAARRLSADHGAEDEDVQWRIRQVDLTARGELVLLVTALTVVFAQPS